MAATTYITRLKTSDGVFAIERADGARLSESQADMICDAIDASRREDATRGQRARSADEVRTILSVHSARGADQLVGSDRAEKTASQATSGSEAARPQTQGADDLPRKQALGNTIAQVTGPRSSRLDRLYELDRLVTLYANMRSADIQNGELQRAIITMAGELAKEYRPAGNKD